MTKLLLFYVAYCNFKQLLFSSFFYSYDTCIFITVDITHFWFCFQGRTEILSIVAHKISKQAETYKRSLRVSYFTRFGGRGREGGRWVKVGGVLRQGEGQIREVVREKIAYGLMYSSGGECPFIYKMGVFTSL